MTKESRKRIDDLSTRFTNWVGSPNSVIAHTVFFIGIFILQPLGVGFDKIMLILTTVVSLEAIYLAIFIQMTVNRNSQSLAEVEVNIDEIQEDVEEIQKDVDEVQKDVDEIQEDVEEIQKDVDEVQKDVDEIQEDVEEMVEDEQGVTGEAGKVAELAHVKNQAEVLKAAEINETLNEIHKSLHKLMLEMEKLKTNSEVTKK